MCAPAELMARYPDDELVAGIKSKDVLALEELDRR